jgi:hypothetical protein
MHHPLILKTDGKFQIFHIFLFIYKKKKEEEEVRKNDFHPNNLVMESVLSIITEVYIYLFRFI